LPSGPDQGEAPFEPTRAEKADQRSLERKPKGQDEDQVSEFPVLPDFLAVQERNERRECPWREGSERPPPEAISNAGSDIRHQVNDAQDDSGQPSRPD